MIPEGRNLGGFPKHHVVAHASAIAGPVLIEGCHCEEIRDVDLGHEFLGPGDQLFERRDGLDVERGLLIRIHRGGHTADQEALEMRVLAAEDRVYLDELALPFERLEIMRDGHQVCRRG
jgi:hypothetical protein